MVQAKLVMRLSASAQPCGKKRKRKKNTEREAPDATVDWAFPARPSKPPTSWFRWQRMDRKEGKEVGTRVRVGEGHSLRRRVKKTVLGGRGGAGVKIPRVGL